MSYGGNNDIIDILKKDDDDNDIQVINRDAYDLNLDHPEAPEPTGLTPILSSLDDPFENLLVTQPKLYSNLPPLQPLSESVLPNAMLAPPQDDSLVNSKKRKEPTSKTKPAFVMKIWSMVNDPSNNEYIRWDSDGKSFQVFHREDFMKNILPKYFKHNNFASFVRQLNMYGWHKVQDISNGTLKDDKTGEENWKFENPYFQRGREDLLDNIVRNKSMAQEGELNDKSANLKILLNELDSIKMNQMAITEDLRRIRKDNKTLWQENYIARDRHVKQSQTLEKILKFLATVYGNNNTGKILEVEENNMPEVDLDHLNNDAFFEELSSNTSKANDSAQAANKPQLMLMNQAYKSSSNPSPDLSTFNSPPVMTNSPPVISNSPIINDNDLINGLEQNIYKQGQSIQQVQDWIQKLSNQQQLQQQQIISQQQQINSSHPLSPARLDLDFDVNDFLRSGANTPANTPQANPGDEEPPRKKRFKQSSIQELP